MKLFPHHSPSHTRSLGQAGERAACDYLEALGHRILERNWRSGHLEIDLVTEAPDGIHIVEVKSRIDPTAPRVEDQVGGTKRRRLAEAASRYLACMGERLRGQEVFFDIVTVRYRKTGGTKIAYYPKAWMPIWFH